LKNYNEVLLAVGKGKAHYVSDNAGRTWRRLEQQATVHSFVFHSKHARWALLSSWTDACKNKHAAGDCVHNLFLTKDLGIAWSLRAGVNASRR